MFGNVGEEKVAFVIKKNNGYGFFFNVLFCIHRKKKLVFVFLKSVPCVMFGFQKSPTKINTTFQMFQNPIILFDEECGLLRSFFTRKHLK